MRYNAVKEFHCIVYLFNNTVRVCFAHLFLQNLLSQTGRVEWYVNYKLTRVSLSCFLVLLIVVELCKIGARWTTKGIAPDEKIETFKLDYDVQLDCLDGDDVVGTNSLVTHLFI